MQKREPRQVGRATAWNIAVALSCAVAISGVDARAAEVEKPSTLPSDVEIKAAEAVLELADPSVDVRDRAARRLMGMGRQAESVLKRAAENADPELSARAKEILLDFRYGLYPETPADVAAILRSYRRGTDMEKREAIRSLQRLARRGMPILVRLAGLETDAALLADIRRELSARPADAAAAYIAEEDFASAEALLDAWCKRSTDNAQAGESAQAYSTYWMLRGKLDDKIGEHRRPLDLMRAGAAVNDAQGPGLAGQMGPQAQLLVHLYRAKGDLEGALWAAKLTDDQRVVEHVLLLRRDWKTLSTLVERQGLSDRVDRLGFRAAYQRLAGNTDGLAKTMQRLKTASPGPDGDSWHAAEALLLNGEIEAGIEKLARGKRLASAFKLRSARHEYDKALALAEQATGLSAEEVLLKAHQGKVLEQLGERDKARKVLDSLPEALRRLRDPELWQEAVEAEVAVGGRDRSRALRLISDAATQPGGHELLAGLLEKAFPRRGSEAVAWVAYFFQLKDEGVQPAELAPRGAPAAARPPVEIVLERAAEVLERSHPDTPHAAALDALAAGARAAAMRMGSPQREQVLRGVGQTMLTAGRDKEAAECWKALAELSDAQGDHLLLADLATRKGNWEEAAELYARAIEKDRLKAYPRFMRGHALRKLGREEEARRMIDGALLIPLANEEERYKLARSLAAVGLDAEAEAQHDIVIKTGNFEYWLSDAQRHLGWRLNAKGDYARAADLWEVSLLDVLHTNINFREEATYLATMALVHKTRAMALAEAGKVSEAMKEAESALGYMPADLNVAIELVPRLERTGHVAEAKALLERELKTMADLAERWPNSPTHHNGLAWLLARVRKDLDRALEHAQKAAALEPENCAILDTLAEVHFQRGDKAKAIETIRKCIELEPGESRHRAALKRFETQGPETAPPAE